MYIFLTVGPWDQDKFIHYGCDFEENELMVILNRIKSQHVDWDPKYRTFGQRRSHVFSHFGTHVTSRFILQHKIPPDSQRDVDGSEQELIGHGLLKNRRGGVSFECRPQHLEVCQLRIRAPKGI